VREADRLAGREDWDALLGLREACLVATEETGRQLWGPARYAAYRTALDGPAELAAAMLEPGVVRFGLGPLTEVVAQQHTFAQLAPHLDATLLPVVAQERVLRGEDLRDDPRARGEADDPPLVLQPFEPEYVLPEYRASERLDGAVPDPSEAPSAARQQLDCSGAGFGVGAGVGAAVTGVTARATLAALEEVVAPWAAQSEGRLHLAAVAGTVEEACCAVVEDVRASGTAAGAVRVAGIGTTELLRMLAFAGASGGVHGRRRGAAAGRSLAWWVARCATGLHRAAVVDPEELEFRLEDVDRLAFRVPGEAAWRLEVVLGAGREAGVGDGGWAVAVAAFDRSDPSVPTPVADAGEGGSRPGEDAAPW